MAIDPRLRQLLDDWHTERDAGKTPTPEDHCRKWPELLGPFRRLLQQDEQLEKGIKSDGEKVGPARRRVEEASSRTVRFRVDGKPILGGMGEVFPACDKELGRAVALKFLSRGRVCLPAQRRFHREVAITARLQHPGVVPIYGPVESDDGRPGYAMRFISGESLDTAITRHHDPAAEETRKPTQDDLLKRFEAVCDTMAYAHRHHVIHRDLKPANVMLGPYGETFVVDWGLGKILQADANGEAATEEPAALTERAEMSSDEALTEDGLVMGTYAYMPPEQARGDYVSLDERADVFALGGILCKILTGQPPYSGPFAREMARNADLTACLKRLESCGADGALVALARRCLERVPADRPGNAEVVRKAMEDYRAELAERTREERERRVAAEARAIEERRRRRVTVALAVSVIVVLLAGGAALWSWQLRQVEKRSRARRTRENVEAALARLDELYSRFLWVEAESLIARTEPLVGDDGDADLRERLAEARENTAFLKRLDEIRLEKAIPEEGGLNFASAVPKYRLTFTKYGFDLLNGGEAELAAKLKTSPLREYLLEALDDWWLASGGAERKRIISVTAAATGKHWRTAFIDASSKGGEPARLHRYDGITIDELTPAIIEGVGNQLDGKDGIQLLEKGVRKYPRDFWLHFRLGTIGMTKERADARIGALRTALALRPGTAIVLFNLGYAHYQKEEYDAAIVELTEAIAIDPKMGLPHVILGGIYYEKGDYDKAAAACQKAISLDPRIASAHIRLGMVFRVQKKYDEAIAEFRKAMPYCRGGGEVLAGLYYDVGCIFLEKEEYSRAMAEFQNAIHQNPKHADAHLNLGNACRELGRLRESRDALREAARLMPEHVGIKNTLRYTESLLTFEERFSAIRSGSEKPVSPVEALNFAALASQRFKKEYALAFRLYSEAFADPKLLTMIPGAMETFRYAAARAAIQLAAGHDVGLRPTQNEQRHLRTQAYRWLSADFHALRKLAASDQAGHRQQARTALTSWLDKSDLTPVRDLVWLKAMPEDERKVWQAFWADVRKVLQELEKAKP